MNIAKLDDFTKYELQTLLNAVMVRIVDLRVQLKIHERNQSPLCVSMDEIHLQQEYSAICLWQTQILNAIGKVGVQEEIAQN